MDEDGAGMKKDEKAALASYQAAAALGSGDALTRLGLLTAAGRGGVKQNDAAAAVYFQTAAQQGDVAGAYYLGRAYAEGRGVEKSDGLAATFYRQAAVGNHPQAAYELGALVRRRPRRG